MASSSSFPHNKDDFDQDRRITFYPEDNKYILEDDGGLEWEWIDATGKWISAVNEDEIQAQQQAYAQPGADDGETAQDQFLKKKRKLLETAKDEPNKKPKPERANTAIYVTSLPLDVTVDEVHQVFSKYGIIAEEIDTNKPRIKLYTDSEGNPKGDALIVYFRPESVQMAINLLDDSDFRWGVKGPDGPMRVRPADQTYKRTNNEPGQAKEAASQPAKRGKAPDKAKIIEKTQKMNQKLADWSDDEDPQTLRTVNVKKKESRWDKFVILRHMFTPEGLAAEVAEDPAVREELIEDVKDQCVPSGEVLALYMYDQEPEGVIQVKFAEAEAARDCVKRLDGLKFDGRTVKATIADGTEKFKKSRKKNEEEDEEERKRLQSFADFIEQKE